MNPAGRAITAAAACFATLPGMSAAEPLGRLFFTPEHRAALERLRQTDAKETAMTAPTLKLDGLVAGAGGKATVWINNRPLRSGIAGGGMQADISSHDQRRVTLTSEKDAPIALRVGESIDRITRRQTDVLPPDAVQVGHPFPAR